MSTTRTAAAEAIENARNAKAALAEAGAADRAADLPCRRCGRAGMWGNGNTYGPCFRCGGAAFDPTRTIPAAKALAAAAEALPWAFRTVAEFTRSTGLPGRLLAVGVEVVDAELREIVFAESVPVEIAELVDAHPIAIGVTRAIVEGRQTRALRPETVEALKTERKAAR